MRTNRLTSDDAARFGYFWFVLAVLFGIAFVIVRRAENAGPTEEPVKKVTSDVKR